MKRLSVLLILCAFLIGVPADSAETKKQTHCPICKMEIQKDLYVDYEGKRVYFGCSGCPDKFRANPETYIKQMEEAGIELENSPEQTETENEKKTKHVQVYCICGSDHMDYSLYADTGGKRVFFCNVQCKDHFMQNPQENLKKMEKKGIKLEDAPSK